MAPERNAPCPCGSGKKYKQCCAIKVQTQRSMAGWVFGIVAVLVVAGAMFIAFSPGPTDGTDSTPEPWYYDARLNQHWHPGHAHWHDGPPPLEQGGNATEPAPWEYEASSDRHWDPNVGDWRPGNPRPKPEPAAWEYDAATNRHWNPEAKEWRFGPPASEN